MSEIVKAIVVTAELTGTELTKHAILAMESDLAGYPPAAVIAALNRCRRELTGRLTLAAIVQRLDGFDGRPSSDEAWAMAIDAQSEQLTVVWNDEIQQAFALARPVLEEGDKIGARMAFKAAYERIVVAARDQRKAPEWVVSLGWDKEHREHAITKAEKVGLLSHDVAAAYLPAPKDTGPVGALLLGDKSASASMDGLSDDDASRVRAKCSELLSMLKRGPYAE